MCPARPQPAVPIRTSRIPFTAVVIGFSRAIISYWWAFPIAGVALTYGYAEMIDGVERLELRTIDLRRSAEPQPVPTVELPEIEL